MSCPGGTSENSPTFQRWDKIRFNIAPVPKGRLNFCGSHVLGINLSRPSGTYYFSDAEPNVETLGYYRGSLRDLGMSLRDSKMSKLQSPFLRKGEEENSAALAAH